MQRYCWHFILAAAAFTASCAKIVVVHVPENGSMTAEGVFYALPKTFVRAAVNVDHVVVKPGMYMQYADVFAPAEDPVCKNVDCSDKKVEQYSLQKNATFAPLGEPDASHVYMVKFVGRGAVDQTVALAWTETGLISTASESVTNRTSDVIVSGLKLAAGVAAKSAFGATKSNGAGNDVCDPESSNDASIIKIFQDPTVPMGASPVLISHYCNLDKAQRDETRFGDLSTFRKAVNAYANNVFPLADSRGKILAGTTGIFEPTELLAQIQTLLAQQVNKLFLGTKETKTWAGSLEIRDLPKPADSDSTASIEVLHIDPAKGFCIGNGAAKSSVSLAPDAKPFPDGFDKLLPQADCAKAPAVRLTLAFSPHDQLFQRVSNSVTEAGDLSFRYRIPAQVRAELSDGNSSYGLGIFSVAQFGTIAALPAKRHTKALSYDLAMVEATGGLKSFKIGATGSIDSGIVDALAGISGTLLDARAASIKADKDAANAAKASKDDVNVLTRQDTLLKLRDDICTIEKKYGIDCNIQP